MKIIVCVHTSDLESIIKHYLYKTLQTSLADCLTWKCSVLQSKYTSAAFVSFKHDKILMNNNCEWQKNLLKSLHNQVTRLRSVTCQILEIYYSSFFFPSVSFPFLLKVCITKSHLVLESSRTGAANFNPFIKKNLGVVFNWISFPRDGTLRPFYYFADLLYYILSPKRALWPTLYCFQPRRCSIRDNSRCLILYKR